MQPTGGIAYIRAMPSYLIADNIRKGMVGLNVLSKLLIRTNDEHPDADKLIASFRYGSLSITSLFYVFNGPASLVPTKIAVVISLYIVSKIITDFYVLYSDNPFKLRLMVLSETLAITLLLVPTGGLDSPFLWYALNPVLVAAWYLSPAFCWFNLFIYISAAVVISAALFKKGQTLVLIYQHQYLLLVFILITLLVQSLSAMLMRLQAANKKQREAMDQMMSLYQIVEAFTSEGDWDGFYKMFTGYTAQLTKTGLAFFWQSTAETSAGAIYSNQEMNDYAKNALAKHISANLARLKEDPNPEFKCSDRIYQAVVIKSSTKLYGLLGLEIDRKEAFEINIRKHLTFLSDLTSIMLDRFAMEEANDRLILLEERNRIANEIHDSVSQRLFSIYCSLHTLKGNWAKLSIKQIQQNLCLLSDSANSAMRELRHSIYSLSTQKSGEKIFFQSISQYLMEFSKLNGIETKVNLCGDEEILSTLQKKSLYRIICEATGNAFRHGKATVINVNLEASPEGTQLVILDNGIGINFSKVTHQNLGLGINNMKNMVHALGGSLALQSCQGTKVEIVIPNLPTDLYRKGYTSSGSDNHGY